MTAGILTIVIRCPPFWLTWLFVSLPSLNNEINSSLHRPVLLDPIMSTLVLLLHPVVARRRSKFIYKSLLAIWSFNVCGQTFCHCVIQIENYYLSAGRRTNCSFQKFFPLCISVELLFCSDEPSGVFFLFGRDFLVLSFAWHFKHGIFPSSYSFSDSPQFPSFPIYSKSLS